MIISLYESIPEQVRIIPSNSGFFCQGEEVTLKAPEGDGREDQPLLPQHFPTRDSIFFESLMQMISRLLNLSISNRKTRCVKQYQKTLVVPDN